jgi:hypothetical protein
VKTLTELREWNITHIQGDAIRFGQSNLDISDEMDLETDRPRYQADRAKDIQIAGTQGIDAAMKANNLDALLPLVQAALPLRPSLDIRPCSFPSGWFPMP